MIRGRDINTVLNFKHSKFYINRQINVQGGNYAPLRLQKYTERK